jgi:hypothetical protein
MQAAWLCNSKDPVDGTDRKVDQIGRMLLKNTIKPLRFAAGETGTN